MPIKPKSYEAEDKYEESWRRYGDSFEPLNKGSGLQSVMLSTDSEGRNTLIITGDPSAKSSGYVAHNIYTLLTSAGMNAKQENKGSTVTFKAENVTPDAIIKAAEALSREEPVDDFYGMLDKKVAGEIIAAEKAQKSVAEYMVKAVTGRAPSEEGRTD